MTATEPRSTTPTGRSSRGDSPGPTGPLPLRTILLIGLGVWIGNVAVAHFSGDAVLLAPLLVLGSFSVPVLGTVLAREAGAAGDRSAALPVQLLVAAFVVGGFVSLALSVAIDAWFAHLPPSELLPIVALAEVSANTLGVLCIAASMQVLQPREGMIVGASVGFGFSALETLGLSFSEIITDGGHSVPDVVGNLLLREALTPFQHGLWTALVGGALFAAASTSGQLRLTRAVAGWFAAAVALHLMWDFSPNFGAIAAEASAGSVVDWRTFDDPWAPDVPFRFAAVRLGTTSVLLLANIAVGVALVRGMWRRSGELDQARVLPIHDS